jgi:uncharacterized repeat protein (TIGR04076 family)
MTHYGTKKGEEFDWKAFQKHMGYSDKELEATKKHPDRSKYVPIMCSPAMQNKWLIIEVVDSHGCGNGLKVGDRLYWEGIGLLDTKRSSRWCPHLMGHISAFVDVAHNFMMQGMEPKFYYNHFSCADAGSKYSWGQVVAKAYVVDTKDLDNLDEISKKIV